MAFKKAGADSAVAHGDLVLLETEVNPVISALQAGGMEITALHNHVLNETPRVMYVHFWGHGAEGALAKTLAAALAKTATPAQAPAPAAGAPPAATDFPGSAVLQTALGRQGTVRGGVLAIAVPRPEKITMMGVELPPSMGMATALNFQDAGAGTVAGTGDFVMIGDEVNKVARALRAHGIEITALHNHMIHGSPELFFMHFWALGTPQEVGAGLKAAVDLLAK
jgi:biotin operon repressor